jgi:Protein of unknown function (DUF1615)
MHHAHHLTIRASHESGLLGCKKRAPTESTMTLCHSGIQRAVLVCAAGLVGCAGDVNVSPAVRSPDSIRADIAARLPATLADRTLWAADIYSVLTSLNLATSKEYVCAVLAVTEQESTYRADPPVANLAKIAREEIFKRADAAGVPALAVRLALQLNSPSGKTYDERLDAVKTEQDLSRLYEDFIDSVPLGKRLLVNHNPVRTAGPMQVSIAFAEKQSKAKPYPFAIKSTLRHEVFTRRGGLYFGTAHLLDYVAPYGDQMIYRFADFNAGQWASRNVAFQLAVSAATGVALEADGDLLVPGSALDAPGETERAVRSLKTALALSEADIRRELALGDGPGLERSPLWQRVFGLAEARSGKKLQHAAIPNIDLKSPKFTRKLTTEWFARRVNDRFQRCLAVTPGSAR